MQNENVLQIRLCQLPDIDYRTASANIACLHGRVVVEMAPFSDKKGSIYLPDKVAANDRSDVGIVLSADPHSGLEPGDCVVVRPYDGSWRTGFNAGAYKAKGEVRMYGVFGRSQGEVELYDWSDSILAILHTDLSMTPLRRNLLIKRDAVVSRDRGLYLPDDAVYRTNIGTVVKAGSDCELSPGARVIYHPQAMLEVDQIDGDPDLGICSEDAIEAILTTDEVAQAA